METAHIRSAYKQTDKFAAVNQAANTAVQCRLAVGAVNDPAETEAEQMADHVMRMPANAFIQRKCVDCEKEEEQKINRKEINQSSSAGSTTTNNQLSNQIESSRGKGDELPPLTKNFMESRFGNSFQDVRIHDNKESRNLSKALNAKAFTSGNDIFFNDGMYNSESVEGQHLLAHELTHTIQQKKGASQNIQRLSVGTVGTDVTGPCGRFSKRFVFTLDNAAPTDGYMVQKIDRYDNEVPCPGMGACPATPSITFYEAFFVQSGSTEFYRHSALGMTDQSSHGSKPNTSGARYALGEIRFFPIATTGNLGRNNTAGLWKPGNAGGVSFSMSLPSTTTAPSWWGSHTEGPATRRTSADWRCCGGSDDFNIYSSDPT
jgi:hypothetical protein